MHLFLAIGACTAGNEGIDSGPVMDPTAPVVEASMITVDPALVAPAVVAHNGPHVVGIPGSAHRRDQLLLFFPGTGATAGDYLRFLTHATERGFFVVGLSYDNRDSVNFDICRPYPDDESCPRDARLEVLRGVASAYSPPEVDKENAAYARLRGLLAWLAETTDPDWAQFLDANNADGIRFPQVVTAGHSQGGGHAAFTARLHPVARALLFDATEAAMWTSEPLATDPRRLYAVVHIEEFGAGAIQRSWDQLGVPSGSLALGDPLPSPLTGHRFVIERDDCTGEGNARLHNCAVADAFLPPDGPDGAVFDPLWNAMLGD
ncbi:MAG: hypothetical protein AAGA48_39395 [Myxococcota bacterium]